MSSSNDVSDVLIGRLGGDHIIIRVIGRMHSNASDYWDGNWLVTTVELSVGGFTGNVGASLRAEEFHAFRMELQRIFDLLNGKAELVSVENWVKLTISIESRGRIRVAGQVRDRVGGGNLLTFTIDELDQSDLPPVIESLEDVELAFPVIGTP